MRARWLRSTHVLLCFLLAFYMAAGSFAPPAMAQTGVFVPTQEESYPIAPGVNHRSMTLTDGEHVERVNLMEIDPAQSNVRLEVTSPKGKVMGLDTVRNQAKTIDRENYRVVGGFNMDFFNTDPAYAGVPTGMQITGGELITAYPSNGGVFSVSADGSFALRRNVKVNATVTAGGSEATLSGVNKPRTASATNHMYLYNSKWGDTTKSSGSGVEVVINPDSAKLELGRALTGTVEAVNNTSNNPIPAGKWVLSASGAQATWARNNLTVGSQVQVKIDLGDLNGAVQAVSGGAMLVENGQPTAEALNDNNERHPRTFLGIKGGRVYMVTFDGRQPTWSDGVTLAEGAKYLQSIGMESAVNMDGGGSTTYALRQPGDAGLSIGNRPSDGFERAVSNALMVVSTAPVTDLAYLVPSPKGPIQVLAGSTVAFSAKGQDQSYNGLPVDPAALNWSADAGAGTINAQGVLTAAASAGNGKVTVSQGAVAAAVDVQVVDTVARLTIEPATAVVNPDSEQTFTVKGYDANGQELLLSANRVMWTAEGGIGTISPNGVLKAVSGMASGKVVATFGGVRAEASVNVGKPPVMIENFEDITDLTSSSARANSVALTLSSRSNPVRFGTHAAKLAYDFTGQAGTSAAYVNFKDDSGVIGRPLEERPLQLGMWVYGDGKNHWLRGQIQDSVGTKKTIDFTGVGELNWVGWKYVTSTLPTDVKLPLLLRQIYLVETSTANKNAGAIYFDDLRAVYSDTGEDLVGPTFSGNAPAAGQKAYNNLPTISAVIRDEGQGVAPGTLQMLLDGKAVDFQYDATTGKVSYTPTAPLADGVHRVKIDGEDKAGNPALPSADWTFTVYTGPDQDAPVLKVIAPFDGTTTRTDQPRIAVQASDEYTGIDFAKVSLEIDGAAVTPHVDQASGTFYYTPDAKWAEGSQHQVKATAVDKNNNAATTSWSFQVGTHFGQPQDPNHFQMSFIGDGGYYTAGQGQTAADLLLREQIARINQEPSELVGYTGDIVENDTAANYATGQANMALFHAPYVVSIGNHEISGTNSRANYQKTFGDPTYFYDYGNTRIIGLDSASGKLTNSDASQWPWLSEVLNSTEKGNIIVIMHVPPDEISAMGVDFNTGHGFKDAQEAQRFYDLLGAYKAAHPDKKLIVFSGDLHAYHHKKVQGVDYIITGGGGKYTHIPAEQGGFFHYVNLKVNGDQITWDVIPLLDAINFTNAPDALEVGQQLTLAAYGRFITSTNDPITLPIAAPFKREWSSSDPNIATVDATGRVTAIAPGTATITVKSGWREASVTVKVPTHLTSDLPGEVTVQKQNKYEMRTLFHPDDAGKLVSLRVTLTDPTQAGHIALKHQDQLDGEYLPIRFDEQGVAQVPATSPADCFMVKFDAAGIYSYKVELLSEGSVLAAYEQQVTVAEKDKGGL
ncbi:MAG: phosphodiester glycosidase family protein [Tumebacillaceae bacterium]